MQAMGNSLTKAVETRMAAMESRLNGFDARLSQLEKADPERRSELVSCGPRAQVQEQESDEEHQQRTSSISDEPEPDN